MYINKLAFGGVRASPVWSHESVERLLLVNFYQLVSEILGFQNHQELRAQIVDQGFAIVLDAISALAEQKAKGWGAEAGSGPNLTIAEVLALEIFNGSWMKEYDLPAITSDFNKLCGI